MAKFNRRLLFTFLTTIFGIYPTTTYAQEINNYEDFQLYCSKGAFYYNAQSPDCEKYFALEAADEKVGMDRQFKQLYLSQLQKLNKETGSYLGSRNGYWWNQASYSEQIEIAIHMASVVGNTKGKDLATRADEFLRCINTAYTYNPADGLKPILKISLVDVGMFCGTRMGYFGITH